MDNLLNYNSGNIITIYKEYRVYYIQQGYICSLFYKGIFRRNPNSPSISLCKLPNEIKPAQDCRVAIFPSNNKIAINLYIKTDGEVLLDTPSIFEESSVEFGISYLIQPI